MTLAGTSGQHASWPPMSSRPTTSPKPKTSAENSSEPRAFQEVGDFDLVVAAKPGPFDGVHQARSGGVSQPCSETNA
jgi:hypothetical protein